MKIQNLICSIAMAVMLCFTALAVPKTDIAGDVPVVDHATKATAAVTAVNHFDVADRATSVFEVAISPPDIASVHPSAISTKAIAVAPARTVNTFNSAEGWIPINGTQTLIESPPINLDAYRSNIWAPNIGYGGRPTRYAA